MTSLFEEFGCALRIRLSPHSSRLYSVDTAYDDAEDAKAACAREAIEEGILEFIRHGNGQTRPALVEHSQMFAREESTTIVAAHSVQGFFESLPRPFPEDVGTKSANEVNAPSWINLMAQGAKGGRILIKFLWILDSKYGCA